MIAVPRVMALVRKDLAELRMYRSALAPVIIVAVLSMAMPFFIALVIPETTGEPLSNDADLKKALEVAGQDLPGALTLGAEGAIQAFIFNRFIVFMLLVPVTGAITFAGHSLIGEKQGRSLEPLLATPITTAELLLGKVLGALIPSVAIMVITFGLYLWLVGVLAEPGVLRAVLTWKALVLVGVVGPLAALVAVQVGVLVSARVNDPRTAQQFGALLILPISLLFLAQMAGAFVLAPIVALAIVAGLALLWGVLLLVGVVLFQRETILTRWK